MDFYSRVTGNDKDNQDTALLRRGCFVKLLLYQPNHTGHHYAYLGAMLPGLLELPVELVLATTRVGVESEEFACSLSPYRDRLRIETCCTPPPKSSWRNGCHRAQELVAAVKAIKPDHVFVLYGDGIWQVLGTWSLLGYRPLPRGLPIEAWLYRGGFAYERCRGLGSWLKRWLFSKILRQGPFAVMHLDDEITFEFAQSVSRRVAKVVLTPNPVELWPQITRQEGRAMAGLPDDARLIGCTGMIDGRKGVDLLLRAFRRYVESVQSSSDRLVLAGPHHEQIKRLLDEQPYRAMLEGGRIISVDRYLTMREMYNYAAAFDLTVACYPNHSGRSSLILWAAAAGRPSLGTSEGCIGYVIEQNELGWTCDVQDIEGFSRAIIDALGSCWSEQDAARVRQYAEFHSFGNYRRVATGLLRERLEMASD